MILIAEYFPASNYNNPAEYPLILQLFWLIDGSLPLSPFEIAMIEILADTDPPSLPEEHVQLLRRFDPLQEEALACKDLNSLLDSEIISRVRELKQSLDSSFYHPGVLATIAPYNAAFGKKFYEF